MDYPSVWEIKLNRGFFSMFPILASCCASKVYAKENEVNVAEETFGFNIMRTSW